ncbi:MAG: hypothetical protein E6Q33_02420 [Neisseriales bacterium]|nr:MAG: hypothetical protein E6Q33_02420 [Neisseriales bacterium]
MKHTISQSEFARRMSTPTKKVTQQMINKYIQQGKLPASGNKLVMPDAESAYHLIMAGANSVKFNNNHYSKNNKSKDNDLDVIEGSIKELKFNQHNIQLINEVDYKSVEVDNGYFRLSSNRIDNVMTAGITLNKQSDLVEFEVINDADYKKALSNRQEIEGFGTTYFLVKESELIEFIKSRHK